MTVVFRTCMENYLSLIPSLSISRSGYIQLYFDIQYLVATIGKPFSSPESVSNEGLQAPVLKMIVTKLQPNNDAAMKVMDTTFAASIQRACARNASLFTLLLNTRAPASSR